MQVKIQFSRRGFLVQGAKLGAAAGVVMVLPGCFGNNSTGSDECTSDPGCSIGSNHGHCCEDYNPNATISITVILTDNGSHFHNVPLSNAELEQIRSGSPVTKNSSSAGGHTHSVQFSLP